MLFKTLSVLALSVSAAYGKTLADVISSTNSLSDLNKLLKAYPAIERTLAGLSNVTVLAPNNGAISALTKSGALMNATQAEVAALLNYHVLPGMYPASSIKKTPAFVHTMLGRPYSLVTGGQVVEVAKMGGNVEITSGLKEVSTVKQADIMFNGGIVHTIDQVLTIPPTLETVALDAGLTAFLGAVTAAGLAGNVSRTPDITIFAPSNTAFKAIGSALGNLTTTQLQSILTYHVVAGTVDYSSMIMSGSVKSLEGAKLNIKAKSDGAVFVNAARVINADILIPGGVMHVIDSVLNPMDMAMPKPNKKNPVVQYSMASKAPITALTKGLKPSTTVKALTMTMESVAAKPKRAVAF